MQSYSKHYTVKSGHHPPFNHLQTVLLDKLTEHKDEIIHQEVSANDQTFIQ